MAKDKTTFLDSNHLFEDVEGETGKTLKLEEDQQSNLVGLIKSRYTQAEDKRDIDERRWLRAYENYR